MGKYTNDYNCDYSLVSGNSLDVDINYCESEIRADVIVHEYKSMRLWGRIINCDGEPVPNALIKLLKVIYRNGYCTYKGIAHTISDCDGFYQFELPTYDDEDESCYKILVSKACSGPERMIPINNNNCNPCNDECQPCDCNDDYDYCDECDTCNHYDDYDHIVIHNKSDKNYPNPKPGCKCGENNPPRNNKY